MIWTKASCTASPAATRKAAAELESGRRLEAGPAHGPPAALAPGDVVHAGEAVEVDQLPEPHVLEHRQAHHPGQVAAAAVVAVAVLLEPAGHQRHQRAEHPRAEDERRHQVVVD